ncbi:MAG TPA: prepilin-type N-terminal cleavage/methylation domain-containing protein [Thermodesulfobacteriota bacterium]
MLKRHSKGFSLVELLIVVALIGILMAIGTPYIVSQLSHIRLTRSVRDAATELNAGRLKAIAHNRLMAVDFTGGDSFNLAMYDTDLGAWQDYPTRTIGTLEPGISITSPGSDFTVQFYPNGTATSTTICVNNPQISGDRMRIIVTGLGMITVENGC